MIFDNFLPFARSGRPISTLFLPFLDQLCAQTKMQQHIDFPIDDDCSVKISSLANLMKNPLSSVAFLNDQRILLIATCLRLQFRSVGSGWQWISEGLNYVKFLFKIVT